MLTVLAYLLTVFLIFANICCAAPASTSTSLWAISIFRGPAPSPEEGPPASANALRDPTKLKFEAVGIAAAYIFWLAGTIFAIYIVRRRFRKQLQAEEDRILRMEVFKPRGQVTLREIDAGPKSPLNSPMYPLSPKSPGKMASIRSWAKGNKGRNSDASLSTVNTRVDERVLEADRAKNLDDMANLYAAVMAHDAEKSTNRGTSSSDSSPIMEGPSPITPRSPRTPRSPHYPPQFAHPAYIAPPPEMYEQNHYEPMPPPPIPEGDEASLLEQTPPRKVKNPALSIISNTTSRLGSSHSEKRRPSAITVGGKSISKPLGSADLRQSAFSGSQTSLQPSIYSPGPPPPTPGRTPARQIEEIEMHGRPQMTGLTSQESINSTGTNAKALPFRQFYQESLKSAPATKTTFLDRRQSAMNGPKTGVPKTPYSPYCPQTPMTPVTPRRLMTKQEIKQNKKQYALKAVREDQMVQSDNDMWGTD